MSSHSRVPRWQGNLTLEFVKSYLKYECLWNPKHEDYRNRRKTEAAYKLIIDDLRDLIKLDVNKVKIKIRSLRTTYSQEVTKIMKNSTDPNHIYESSLIWFHAMDNCLKDIVSPRGAMQMHRNSSDWNDSCDAESSDDSNNTVKYTNNEASLSTDSVILKDPISDTSDVDQKNNNTDLFHIPKQAGYSKVYEDEYDLFGKYISAQLRKLPLKSSMRCKVHILNILSNARLSST